MYDRDSESHDQDNIYTKENPYGTSTTGLYVYFTTARAAKVSYRVSNAQHVVPGLQRDPEWRGHVQDHP